MVRKMQAGNSTEDARSANDSSFEGRNFEANLELCNFVGCNCEHVCGKVATFHETTLQENWAIRRTTTATTTTKSPARLRAVHVYRSIKTHVLAE